MANNSLVSIIIPLYNASTYIEETITCFLNQTYENIEIIVQDDCSTDGSWLLVNQLFSHNPKVKLFRNDKNLGIGANWNRAFEKINGEFVVVANADDIFADTFIANGIETLQDSQIDIVCFSYKIKDEVNQNINGIGVHNSLPHGHQNRVFYSVFFSNPFSIVFSICRSSTLKKYLLDNENLFLETQVCDMELLLRLAKNRCNFFFYKKESAGYYRKHVNNNSYKNLGEAKSWLYDVFPKYSSYLFKYHKLETIKVLKARIISYLKSCLRSYIIPNLQYLSISFKTYINFRYKNGKI